MYIYTLSENEKQRLIVEQQVALHADVSFLCLIYFSRELCAVLHHMVSLVMTRNVLCALNHSMETNK